MSRRSSPSARRVEVVVSDFRTVRTSRDAEFIARGRRIVRDGWQDYIYTWSTGEVIIVALILQDDIALQDVGYSHDEAMDRVAGEFWAGQHITCEHWLYALRIEVQGR